MPLSGVRTDTDIAEAAANTLRWHVSVSDLQIKPVVKDGWVTLTGKRTLVSEDFGRECRAAADGVKGITNNILVTSPIKVSDVKQKIEEAFKRHAILDAKDIEVKVDSSTVTSRGMSIRGGA